MAYLRGINADILEYIELADASLDAGNTEKAETRLRAALVLADEAGSRTKPAIRCMAEANLAGVLVQTGRQGEAGVVLGAIEVAPANDFLPLSILLLVAVTRSRWLLATKEYKQAIDELSPFFTSDGTPTRLLKFEIWRNVANGNLKSLGLVRRLCAAGLELLGIACFKAGHYDAGERSFRRLLKRRRGTAGQTVRLRLALAKAAKGDSAGAKTDYSAICRRGLPPKVSSAEFSLMAELAQAVGEIQAAIGWLEKSLAEAEVTAMGAAAQRIRSESFGRLGQCYLSLGQAAKAEAAFRTQEEIQRRLVPADEKEIAATLVNLAASLCKQGRFDAALTELLKVLSILYRAAGSGPRSAITAPKEMEASEHGSGDVQATADAFARVVSTIKAALPDGDETRQTVLQTCRELGYE